MVWPAVKYTVSLSLSVSVSLCSKMRKLIYIFFVTKKTQKIILVLLDFDSLILGEITKTCSVADSVGLFTPTNGLVIEMLDVSAAHKRQH